MAERPKPTKTLTLTAQIVAAHVSKNRVAVDGLPRLIEEVYKTLAEADVPSAATAERPRPVVPIKKSVTPDYIICLEDGRKLKMLKRHLRSTYNLTPEEYRERWGLAPNYPMVAPNYTKQRRRLAKQIGLGTRTRRRRR
ncbi:MAG: MucR family transcriptional regulator [Alphaproteobacteria bacterium]